MNFVEESSTEPTDEVKEVEVHAGGDSAQRGNNDIAERTAIKAGSKRKLPHSSSESGTFFSTLPSSVISSLTNEAGERAGPPVDIPVTSTAKQLQLLVNSLLSNEEKVFINVSLLFIGTCCSIY